MDFDKEGEFSKIMEEIFPVSIPAQFVKEIVVKFGDGKEVILSGEELSHPVPVAEGMNWDRLKNQFDKIVDIDVLIDIPAIQHNVSQNVKKILDNHFKDQFSKDND